MTTPQNLLGGRYRVLSLLGKGGMGEVFLVEHSNLLRREALKVLRVDPRFDAATVESATRRFRREARALARLAHPNIVSVYDYGTLPDGSLYLTMEYVPGSRLDQLIANQPFDLGQVRSILIQLAHGLGHAHDMGVVHRDLKPQNLMFLPDSDTLKILDFGIAKILARDYLDSGASREDVFWGTAGYVSPEQIQQAEVDGRSDIYTIGVLAHEMITGRLPFVGARTEVIKAHLKAKAPPPSQLRHDAYLFDDIVLRCLEKRADRRFQTATDLRIALELLPVDLTQATPMRTKRPSTGSDDGEAITESVPWKPDE